MNIKLKHIAPYFPYSLMVSVKRKNDTLFHIGRVCEITNKSNHGDWVKVWFDDVITVTSNNLHTSSSNSHTYFLGQDSIKPVLRPLSDLIKEIVHNDEKFVPLDELDILYDGKHSHDDEWIRDTITRGHTWTDMDTDTLTVKAATLFLRWHFDIYGLIDKGLAVDMNFVQQ